MLFKEMGEGVGGSVLEASPKVQNVVIQGGNCRQQGGEGSDGP